MNVFIILICSLMIGINATGQAAVSDHQTEPSVIIVFGATGDLTARKLLPAIYNLAHDGKLAPQTAVVGSARRAYTHESFRTLMGEAIGSNKDLTAWNQFADHLYYHQADFDSDEGYENLKALLATIDQEWGTKGNRIYYLATQPSYFSTIIKKLSEHELLYTPNDPSGKWSRVIIEKPFGHDLDSAIDLQRSLSAYLDESQIYRMDHYLGKEGVQNLFTFRFEGGLLEPLWNSEHIDNVQITLSEELGIGTRAHFWEETGSLRDVFQNHLMQLLAIVAMEPPSSLEAPLIHEEKIRVLNSIRPFPVTEMDAYVVRGQYGPGTIRNISVPGYKQELNVSQTSTAETFMAAKLFIDNARWKGVPFYLRAGKRLPKQTTEIVITFKNPTPSLDQPVNTLFIRIQPNTGIFLKTVSKVPQLDKSTESVVFGFIPDTYFGKSSAEAYEKLFYDCIRGDDSLYVQGEEQLAAWRLLTPVLNHWGSQAHGEIQTYEAGSWGPTAADRLLQESWHHWQLLENSL